ncbi:hypothetical protein [Argonema galeatum]|uniref:hypothetical protein n=1 Tax=Argonema galeatum TaxID=2942762 RepID=UPI00201198AC|nr:hypothetical protein [Argonema galeatum]MCL1464410.1 hypothetical protein [Argonema galeatum A003/A1]
MLIKRLHQFLTDPLAKPSKNKVLFWLGLSLIFATIYGILGLQKGLGNEYVVQDDARQYVFLMQRFADPQLLPNDLIADYYQSVTPPAYSALYQLMAGVGIPALLLSKILPMVLGLITTVYAFGVCMQILPLPVAGFISTLLLNQSLWMKDDLVSATPRAFLYPLFTAFLYYLLRRSWLPCLVTVALQGLFYPLVVLISIVLLFLRLWNWEKGLPHLSGDRKYYAFLALALGVALLSVLPSVLASAKYGPTITGSVARTLPEFLPGGRAKFFHSNFLIFWLNGKDSGLLPWLKPQSILVGFSLPFLLRYPSRFPLIKQFKRSRVKILGEVILASLVMFLAAHALLFKLYCPSRYTEHTLRIVLALAGGLALTLLLDALLQSFLTAKPERSPQPPLPRGAQEREPLPRGERGGSEERGYNWKLWVTGAIAAALILHPNFLKNFPTTAYKIGRSPELYQFFQKQPKDITIASLEGEANLLPTFSKRSILVSSEYSLPYHTKYYAQIRQRAIDLIHAQYTLDGEELKSFIQKYGVDFWMIEESAFTPQHIETNPWLMQYQPAAKEAITRLQQGIYPALAEVAQQCTVLKSNNLVVMPAECIIKSLPKN